MWAQLDGVYNIANYYQHNSVNTTGNWYLVPTQAPSADKNNKNRDIYYSSDGYATPGSADTPFLTTYQTYSNNQTISPTPYKPFWVLQSVPNQSGYYYIIHVLTGKYIVYQPPHNTNNNNKEWRRKSVHLQETNSPGDNAIFKVVTSTFDGDYYNIIPKSLENNKSYRFFNPAGSQENNYRANSQGSAPYWYLGLVGVYDKVDGDGTASNWYLEDAFLTAPTISAVDPTTSKVTITDVNSLPAGYHIHYTVSFDGNEPADPTVDSDIMTDNEYTVSRTCIIKAVVERYGVVLTDVVTSGTLIPSIPDPPTITDDCDNTFSIISNIPSAAIFYNLTTDGTEPADPTASSTLYNGTPITFGATTKVKAIAVVDSKTSEVASYTFTAVHPDAPVITLGATSATISAASGATIYYTTDGNDPTENSSTYSTGITISEGSDVDIRAIAVLNGKESCVAHAGRFAGPTLTVTDPDCATTNLVTITAPNGRTLWYAYTAGNNTAAPAKDTFTRYSDVFSLNDISDISGTNAYYTVHAYAKSSDGTVTSDIVSVSHQMKTPGTPTLTAPTGSSNELDISNGTAGDKVVCSYTDNHGIPQNVTNSSNIVGSDKSATFSIPNTAVGTLTVSFQRGEWQPSCTATYTIPGAPETPTASQSKDNKLSLSCATEMAEIYYTICETCTGFDDEGFNDPTRESESYYAGCFNGIKDGTKIKAVAYKGFKASGVLEYTYHPENPNAPTFFVDGNTVQINSPEEGATVYYTVAYTTDGTIPADPADPTQAGSNPVSFSDANDTYDLTDNKIAVFLAYAEKGGHTSNVVRAETRVGYSINSIERLNAIAGDAQKRTKYWYITADFSAANYTSSVDFTGVLVGNNHTISGLTKPLFATATDAVIHDLNLKDVTIDGSGDVGAIASTATGNTRIYNCGILPTTTVRDENNGSITGFTGSTLSSSGNESKVGSLVGSLEGNARVINCFSYANITGGTNKGGIVGYNSFASTSDDIRTMVMNCMFYGDISTGGTISPIYGGSMIKNYFTTNDTDLGLNNYNYFRFNSGYVSSISAYNCALGAEDDYLDRFEFFRHTLNSTRDLASWYVTGSVNSEEVYIAKWVIDKEIAPFPILKEQGIYPSVVNHDAANSPAIDADNVHRNEGRKLGTLTVYISALSNWTNKPNGASRTQSSLPLIVTDKDTTNYDFNYKKVQLPYYREVGTGNYTSNKVVTGWKITNINGGTPGKFTTGTDAPAYNFVDRKCTNKDLYSESGRIFSQGAYWEVPDGVNSITIEPVWADCVYLADANYDVTYKKDYSAEYQITTMGTRYNSDNTGTYEGQTVYTSFSAALEALNPSGSNTVYEKAIVLVGNYHKCFGANSPCSENKPFTMMSADLNEDNEPDFCFFYEHRNWQTITPIRFDFITVPAIALVMRAHGATTYPLVAVFYPMGWFEMTNTSLMHFNQFEYSRDDKKTISAPLILMGGIYNQFISARDGRNAANTPYIHIGGNAYFKEFNNGGHTKNNSKTPKNPINVSGGDFGNFYLSGIYRPEVVPDAENAECYIDGGRFGEVAGAGMQKIDGDVTWIINGADIKNFYGGGINPIKNITGSISTTITNSWVTNFYGGPKFGNMETGKTVTTYATDCHFGRFYGAGYGGNAYNKEMAKEEEKNFGTVTDATWNGYINDNYGRQYVANKGIATSFDYEFLIHSKTTQTVSRFYVNYASLSLASTHNVTSELTDCTIEENFYGGGRLGAVNGDISSTLTNCDVHGNIFGAGESATTPTIMVMPKSNFVVAPSFNNAAGVFNDDQVQFPTSVKYTWTNSYGSTDSPFTDDGDNHWIYTSVPLTGLGKVNGTASLTINGKSAIGTQSDAETGNVYGGGELSNVQNNTSVEIDGRTIVLGSVYGGGKGKADNFTCDKAMVGDVDSGSGNTSVTISNGTIEGNVYGGGQIGRVENNTEVTIGKQGDTNSTPTISGYVFGAGAGVKTHGYSALVRGNSKVTIQGSATVGHSVYGGGEIASVGRFEVVNGLPTEPKSGGACTVIIQDGAQIGTVNTGGDVFGACKGVMSTYDLQNYKNFKSMQTFANGSSGNEGDTWDYYGPNHDFVWKYYNTEADYLAFLQTLALASNPKVTISGNATINGSVFGGGQRGITLGNVVIDIAGGTVNQDVYGGGALADTNKGNWDANGATWADATQNSAKFKTAVNLTGGYIKGDAYGGGLGQKTDFNGASSDIEATVWGDIHVTLNGTKFDITKYTDEGHTNVVKSGRVFGCNNLLGSPRGNVTVTVQKTVAGNSNRSETANKTNENATYEVAAVYGGGNLADYTATGKKTHVIINGCGDTSIQYVYGGGNAAAVPETDVDINAAYEIGSVFGGGNGKDKYKNDIDWQTNLGANVSGNASTTVLGGTIHEAYGASNEKGSISGSVSINTQSGGSCPLSVGALYGAGNNADVDGDMIVVLGCLGGDEEKTNEVYGGAKNANVKGNVELTITSGSFGKVFGGNNQSGAIFGHIIVNIEESGCTPIKIDELYLGGNEAAYSTYGYYKDGIIEGTEDKPKYVAKSATDTHPAVNFGDGTNNDHTKAPYADPVLNIISATHIGKVFGGGLGSGAIIYGNPTVNINQTYPLQFASYNNETGETTYNEKTGGGIGQIGGGYTQNNIYVEGGIYGGGNEAPVYGNTTVNIGNKTTVDRTVLVLESPQQSVNDANDKPLKQTISDVVVQGANIAGNVYGGGNLADVTGNTQVNICAVKTNDTYSSVAPGTAGVTIAGNVFGGGKGDDDTFTCEKAMVGTDGAGTDSNYSDGNTAIVIGNGTINGNVYGGGEIGRVEKNASVTVGLGDGVASGDPTSAPEIKQSVFGGGKGVKTHGYSALLRGNPTVTVQGNAKVRGNVYGGGEIASVARYKVAASNDEGAPYGVKKDMPYALKDANSGFCAVTVKGYAEIGPATIDPEAKKTSVGHVFGAGKGILPGGNDAFVSGLSRRMIKSGDGSDWETFDDENAYITFIQTLALASQTNVTIDGNAKVKGSVYGGSESGFVQFDTNVNVLGGTIGVEGKGGADFGNVYGGGKGDVEYTGVNHDYVAAGIVKGNTKVKISEPDATHPTLIYHNIYGGGAYGTVGEFVYDTNGLPTGRKTYTIDNVVQSTTGGKAEIHIIGGTIGTNGNENGMIFGSSRGDVGAPHSIHDKVAWVYDTHVAIGDTTANATITTATPLIKGSVYGGGENGHNLHNAYVRINGGTTGIADGETIESYSGAAYPYRGNVYGGGCGTDKYYSNTAGVANPQDGNGDTYNPLAGIVQGNAIVNITAGHVVHNVYGAGAMGSVGKTVTTNGVTTTTGGLTTVSIGGGTIGVSGEVGDGNVFGAARGNLSATGDDLARVRETHVTISNGIVKGNVYGGGQLGDVGTIAKNTTNYNYIWKKNDGSNNTANNNKISGTNTNTGICNVTINGGTIGVVNPTDPSKQGNVFGAGKGEANTWWCEKAIAYATNVSVTKGTVYGNVYGGGEVGRVEDDAKVTIGTASGTDNLTITGSVYGAGAGLATHGYSALVRGNSDVVVQGVAQIGGSVYGGGEIASVGRFTVVGGLPKHPDSGGTCTVMIKDDATIAGEVFGACKGVDPANIASADRKSMQLYKNAPGDASLWSYYEPDHTYIWRTYKTEADYLAFLETLALTSNTDVTINGRATINESVYGGGQRGITLGSVKVEMLGGTVNKDVYGGGALANTNTGNWDKDKYVIATGLTAGESIVTGLYIISSGAGTDENPYVYEEITEADTKAVSGTTYYVKGAWSDNIKKSALYTTTVNLTGGMIKGDAYGGGLGQLESGTKGQNGYIAPIEAMVYGDVSVNQGSPNVDDAATAYTITYLPTTDLQKDENDQPIEGSYVQVVNSGRIFGCNNLNGSPKGNVTVTVNGTVPGKDGDGNVIEKTFIERDETTNVVTIVPENHTYEVAAVYGGGNLADYTPEIGSVMVRINSCDVSIEEVYGGGNAAKVPSTDVLVMGAHEIEHVFGGGNGEDKYTLDGGTTWIENPGADVNGDAVTLLKGGLIHEAYGGSNKKGTISGNITIDTGTGGLAGCPVKVDKLVGAGKDADVNGNLIMILGCYPTTRTPLIFAGADNANVNGDVELTITSGTFGQVFGGNNEGGAIRGHIKLNIEETGCNPIVIDELYLGGNNAAYSRYGYYVMTEETEAENGNGVGASTETAILTDDKLTFVPRTSDDDPHLPVKTYEKNGNNWTWTTDPISGNGAFEPYAQPVLNVTSCTSIGEVFGGGYGVGGTMYADPTVNINMIPGEHAAQLGDANKLGAIGNVYGGGNAAAVYGDATVNIGTEETVDLHKSYDKTTEQYTYETKTVTGANITGNVYGGGKKADIGKTHLGTNENGSTIDVIDLPGNTSVNICAVKDATDATKYNAVVYDSQYPGVTIGGSVFGGGEGEAKKSGDGAFRCGKAMVTGSTNVIIGNGKVTGSVFGGGEIGRVEENTTVTIGIEGVTTSTPEIKGDVFGAGKGVHSHGYAALVRGNTHVYIQGNAKVKESVYGGGKIASVGRYNIADAAYHALHPKVDVGMPYSLADNGSGYCTVVVRDNAEVGPDDMQMTKEGGPDDTGYVFGAGKGILAYEGTNTTDNKPGRAKPDNTWQDYSGANNEEAYLRFIETQGLATQTDVTITGNAFIKGSVYGGSFNGHVQHDTHVTIAGNCQIGAGYDPSTKKSLAKYSDWPTDASGITTSWKECSHWDYDPNSGAPYDMYANYSKTVDGKVKYYYDEDCTKYAEGGCPTALDGHTFYGNVFGGGSGYIPYAPGKWHREAGSVGGDTYVNITGGHILTSVYGGNEMTDVGTYQDMNNTTPESGGKCTINMTGGTIGVPRTVEDMIAHPVTCYLFGAGKGDQRIFFNTWTNVVETEVNISGDARIYGSVFGGGEDGHVIGDANINIGGSATIGTTGTSYVDGNVFGGGRGFSGEAQTAGTLGGNVTMTISGGTMLGSVYGGGRLASVGTQFTAPEDPNYGNFVEDNEAVHYTQAECDAYNTEHGFESGQEGFLTTSDIRVPAGRHGHITINISGGTIGNDLETKEGNIVKDKIYSFALETSGQTVAQIDAAKKAALQAKKVADKIPVTEFELYDSVLVEGSTTKYTYYYRASHTKGGNVFGGSMGRLELLNGSRNPIWPKMAQVKTSDITISGDNTLIKRSVYGGGEMGTVRDNATVTISNGTIWRDVYGGGYGSEDRQYTIFSVKEPNVENPSGPEDYDTNTYAFTPMQFAGCVGKGTTVNISGGYVWKNVYGGGEMASVGIFDSQVVEVNSEPSKDKIVVGQKDGKWTIYNNMSKHWDVENEFGLSWPYEFTYLPIYPGTTQVNVTGGRIGLKKGDGDINSDNGDVCGGGKGLAGDYNDYVFCANVGSSEVNINYTSSTATPETYETTGDCITGAVYGGAENGHVMGNTKLTLTNGLIGHSIYGGGSGKGQFNTRQLKIGRTPGSTNDDDYYKRAIYSITSGKVFGNTDVLMEGGRVIRNVYGGGNMGSVGKGNYAGGLDDYSAAGYGEKLQGNNKLWDGGNKYSTAFLNSGKCKVKITGGTIGYIDETNPSNSMYPWNSTASLPYGNVFGGCRGESAPNISESPRYLYSPEFFVGYVNETEVIIEGNNTKILGSVYGGGMDGHVRRDASVTINGGEIGIPYTEANISKVKTGDLTNIQWLARGNVYGAGSGIGKYKYDFDYDGAYTSTVTYNGKQTKEEDFSTSAGSVTRFTTVTINGGTIHRNVYGGGSLASVGAPKIPPIAVEPIRRDDNATTTQGKQSLNEVTITAGNIGDATSYAAGYGGHVFGASRGDASLDNPTSFAKAVWTDVNVGGGTILGDVYGGGEVGTVRQGTEVDLTGGTIDHDVFGGGKGTSTVAADIEGDVLVTLNGTATEQTVEGQTQTVYLDNAVVKGSIFGANNINGTPKGHVTVHVYKTTAKPGQAESDYDVAAVYGGGKQADYVPTDNVQSTEVIIEGCDLTSIQEVYGGGYGAATPGTNVLIKGTKEIDNVFGGGYGAGEGNPGANVGYRTGGTTAYGLGDNNTKTANVQLMAGKINNVYGGSNTKGDIRGGSSITNVTKDGSRPECCDELDVGNIYGGGKDAEMTGGAEIILGCMPNDWIEEIYAGAQNADVGSDVSLTITSGKFGRVFGGNKTSGRLHGSIVVNIEENPECTTPIIIGELYAGGNKAPYSIYGYKDEKDANDKWIPRQKSDYDAMSDSEKEAEGIGSAPHNGPMLNVRAFTSIGNIFGGGYGESAVMVGSPVVNINVVEGGRAYAGETKILEDGVQVTLQPRAADSKMGVIGTVFGGGNAAKVIGDTHVNIGTTATETFVSVNDDPTTTEVNEKVKTVVGADIKGNVYGGGNNAEVTGDTDVVIGKKED